MGLLKMKIVMFTDAYWPRVNGVTVSVETFSRALIKAGHQVVIICSFYPESQAIERMSNPVMDRRDNKDDPVVIRVPSYPLPISKEDRLAKFHKWFWVSKQLNAFEPDVIHVQTEFIIGEFGFYYAKLHNLPTVYTFHTLWEDYIANYIPYAPEFLLRFIARRVVKHMARRADAVIAPTEQIIEVLRRYKVKKPAYLLPTGIDPTLFTHTPEETAEFRQSFESKYPALRGKRILLFAGRVGKEKNISFLLACAADIMDRAPDTALVIAGNGPDLSGFMEEAESLGIAERCVFTGYLDRKDLALLYAAAEVFTFPSLTETQGLVTVEAMLSGTPVVAIGAMGTLTVMGGDNGGFMVRNDRREFTDRVIDLLENRDLLELKSAEAMEHGHRWTIDRMADKLEAIYRETLER